MDKKTKRLIEDYIKQVRLQLDKANDAPGFDQSTVNGALIAAMAYLVDVVEKQQEQIEAQQAKIEELHNDLWEHDGDVSLHNERAYR